MKARLSLVLVVGFASLALNTSATVFYVDLNSASPTPPYTNWVTAAVTIQDAVSQANPGDTVLVTNGVYEAGGGAGVGSNRVSFTVTNLTVRSVSGPGVTIIKGCQLPGTTNGLGAARGVYLTPGSTLSGFTVTGGATLPGGYGGGIYSGNANAVITNCVITGNASASYGGGAYYGTLINCTLAQNVSASYGGGSRYSLLTHCLVISNSANYGGGTSYGSLTNCVLAGNNASAGGGGAHFPANTINCTIVGNHAGSDGGGILGNGMVLWNCIVYDNTAGNGVFYSTNIYDLSLNMYHCCTIPLAGKGSGNITNPPAFINLAGGNYRLQIGSPCMDAGTNFYVSWPMDLDGNPRIARATVDIGAYENQYAGAVHFVSRNSTNPVSPYTNWPTAATNIQDAIGAALSGEMVVADSGVYSNGNTLVSGVTTNRVALTNDILLLGIHGPASTVIVGGTQTRGVYLGSNAILSGFAITNGQTSQNGGGIWSEPSGVVSNCIVTRNASYGSGGGMYGGTALNCTFFTNNADDGGGAYLATLINCQTISNWASHFGGGAYTSVLYNCTLTGNSCSGDSSGGGGGGVRASRLYNCVLTGNRAINSEGGGAYASVLYNCTLSSNRATYYGGGGAAVSMLHNCYVAGNSSANYGGGTYQCTNCNCVLAGNTAANSGGGAYVGKHYNCTIIGNSAPAGGGLFSYGGSLAATLTNCIVYFNSATFSSNWSGGIFDHCCTIPLPSGPGNITNEPAFVSLAANDLRLHFGSPCIDAGTNLNTLITNDLDGNLRPLDGNGDGVARFDIGAYEFDLLSTVGTDWLLSYGLDPEDPLVFMSHPNDHPLTVLQSWIADQNPTNPESLFRILTISSGPPTLISFSNSASRVYTLLSNTNLGPAWTPVPGQANVPGNGGVMALQDTNIFPLNVYRVGVSIP